MLSLNNKISIRQLQALIILNLFGLGIAVVPRLVAGRAGQDGWVSVVFGTLAAVFCALILCTVAEQFSDKSFLAYSRDLLSKPIGTLISSIFVLKIILDLALQLRFFGEIMRQIMLPHTPFSVVALSMLLLSAFIAAKGYESRARMAELLLPFCLIPLIIVFILALFEVDIANLQPTLVTPIKPLALGSLDVLYAFSGMELILLAYPHVQNPKRAKTGILLAITVIGLLMILVTVLTLARFGALDVSQKMWPTIEMMNSLDLAGSLIERQDALIMSFWIISVFVVVNAGLFFSGLLLEEIVEKGKSTYYIAALIPLIFLLSLIPRNISQVYEYMILLRSIFGAFFIVFLPIILLLAAFLQNKFVRSTEYSE